MGAFLAYSIQSAICLILFYLFYKVLLSRETFHRFNRIALLSILAFSLAIPICGTLFAHIGTSAIAQEPVTEIVSANDIVTTPITIAATAATKSETFLSILLLIYLAGCATMLIFSAIMPIHILRLIHEGKCKEIGGGVRLVIHPSDKISPFSWMRYIVISKTDFVASGSDAIITHEKAHIRLHHSCDLILGQLCLVLQWFNPAAWLLYQELQTVHEYEADEDVLRHGIDAHNYQLLLIKKTVGKRLYSIANSLNQSNLKKRITMMLKRKSNSWARLKYAYVLPLAATAVAAFAHPEISQKFDEISSAKITNFASIASKNDVKNLTETNKDLPMQDTVHISNGSDKFNVIINGETKGDNNVVVIKTEEEAGRKKAMAFVKNNGNPSNGTSSNYYVNVVSIDSLNEKPFIIIDEKESTKEEMNELNPDNIESVYVLKGDTAIKNYGEKGKNGVIIINTKTNPQQKAEANKSDHIYTTVDEMPEFPGGCEALLKWINEHIKYPDTAVQGRVPCLFTVLKDGSVTDVTVVRSSGSKKLDDEAVRVLSMLPKFKPGKNKGVPVDVKYIVPVRFKLK